MRASHDLSRVQVRFDEPNLVPSAGLLPAAALAQRLGVERLVDDRLTLAAHGHASGAKALTVLGSMLAGGDSIRDVNLLRTGATDELFDGVRAPSTIGTWLRAFKWSNVRQLDAISRELLARMWSAGAGPADLAAPLTIDVDSTICEVYGRSKQGAGVRLHQGPRLPPAAGHLRADRAGAVSPTARRQRRPRPRRGVVPDRDGQPGPVRRRDRTADRARGL